MEIEVVGTGEDLGPLYDTNDEFMTIIDGQGEIAAQELEEGAYDDYRDWDEWREQQELRFQEQDKQL